MGGVPVTLVSSDGVPVVPSINGVPVTHSTSIGAEPVMIVDDGHGEPVNFVNADTQPDLSSLFAASSNAGGVYTPWDLSTLWQDSARTTQVSSDGDPVGAMDDVSGNGNHLTQSTAGNRPTYKTSGGLHWIEADGTTEIIKSGTFTINQPWMRVSAFRALSWTNADRFYSGIAAAAGVLYQSGSSPSVFMYNGSNGPTASMTLDTDFIVTELNNGANSTLQLNNATATTGNPGSTETDGISLFGHSAGAVAVHARFYGAMMIDRELTATELKYVKDVLSAKAGLSL